MAFSISDHSHCNLRIVLNSYTYHYSATMANDSTFIAGDSPFISNLELTVIVFVVRSLQCAINRTLFEDPGGRG